MRYEEQTLPEIGIAAAYGNAWRQLWENFLILFIIGIVSMLLAAPAGVFNLFGDIGVAIIGEGDNDATTVLGGGIAFFATIFSFFYGILITAPLKYGVDYTYLRAARNDPLDIVDMFAFIRNYIHAVMATILVGIIVTIGFIFFIIPGIYLACKLAFTPYLIVDRRLNVIDALQESWEMTDGHAFKVFMIGLLGIPITLGGLMLMIVGIIPAIMWVKLAYASLYHAIEFEEEIEASMYGAAY
ncbi:MAG: hypothetical protein VCD00_15375 [Candidatus Hydrogenedentota bacterium]